MALTLYVAKIAVDRDTGLPLPELRGQGGTIIARGNPSSIPTIYEDKAGSLVIPGSAVTVNENGFTSSFWVDDSDLPISWWDGSVEVPLESVEGIAVRLDDLEVLFSDTAQSAAAAQSAAEAAQAAAEAVEISGGVISVAGKTGNVSLVRGDVGLGNVNNTADTDKPVSGPVQAALNGKLGVGQSIPITQVTSLRPELDSKRGQNDPVDGSLITTGQVSPARLGSGTTGDSAFFLASDGVFRKPESGSGSGVTNAVIVGGDSNASADTSYGGALKFHEILANTLGSGVEVVGAGIGGATTTQVASALGAVPVYLTVTGNTVPSSGGVAITAMEPSNASYGADWSIQRGTFGGVAGRVLNGAFVRTSTGASAAVQASTAYVSDWAQYGRTHAAVVWTGNNDAGASLSAADAVKHLRAIDRQHAGRMIVITPKPGHTSQTAIDTVREDAWAEEFGPRCLNVRSFLNAHGLAWAGLSPTSGDSDDIAAGKIPRSLFAPDGIHLNNIGSEVVCRRIAQMLTSLGFVSVGTSSGSGDTSAPTTPGTPTYSALASSSFDVTWSASSDNVGVTGYQVYVNGALYTTTASTSASITGRTPSTSYAVTVRARDAAGNLSPASGTLNVTTSASSDSTAPSTPAWASPAYTSLTSTGLTLHWEASTDNVGVTGYQVYVDGVPRAAVGNVLTESVGGLTADTSHAFQVRARDAAGNWSSLSATLNVSTLAPVGASDYTAAWALEEGTGATSANLVPGGPVMTLNNAAWTTPGLNGSSAALVHSTASGTLGAQVTGAEAQALFPPAMAAFTVSLRVKPSGMHSGAQFHAFAATDNAAAHVYIVYEGGAWKAAARLSGTDRILSWTTAAPTAGVEHHIAMTLSGATITFWYDGVQRATDAYSGSLTGMGSNSPRIQFPWNQWGPGPGTYDDLRIYNRALSQAEIEDLAGV